IWHEPQKGSCLALVLCNTVSTSQSSLHQPQSTALRRWPGWSSSSSLSTAVRPVPQGQNSTPKKKGLDEQLGVTKRSLAACRPAGLTVAVLPCPKASVLGKNETGTLYRRLINFDSSIERVRLSLARANGRREAER